MAESTHEDRPPLQRCTGTCHRVLPHTLEHFSQSRKGLRRDGSIPLRKECRDCRRAYHRRVNRQQSLRRRLERIGAEKDLIDGLRTHGQEAEYVIKLCRELEQDGMSLKEWLDELVTARTSDRSGACQRRRAAELTQRLIDLLLRSFARTEAYLLLLAGEEPVERSRLITGEELDEI